LSCSHAAYQARACLPDGVLQLRLKDMPTLKLKLRLTLRLSATATETERETPSRDECSVEVVPTAADPE
jgi:hypothetical protein